MTDFWSTTISGIRDGTDFSAISHYREPIARYLEVSGRYRWIPEADRQDIVQEVIVGLWERGLANYDAAKGPFRRFLQGVIQHKVGDHLRKRNGTRTLALPEHPDAGPASPSAEEVATLLEEETSAVVLSAKLIEAVRRFHDRCRDGSERERERLYCLCGRLVHGWPQHEIAAREGLSRDQVKRHLEAARREIIGELLHAFDEPEQKPLTPNQQRGATTLIRAALSDPTSASRTLGGEADARVAERATLVADGLLRYRTYFTAGSKAWTEFVDGLEEIFEVRGHFLASPQPD